MTTAPSILPLTRDKAGHLPGMLEGLRVVELADETAEYVGMTLAGLGAEVIKVEPPQGASTRAIGPFMDDEPGPERSLHFWGYNRGKRSVVLDLDAPDGQQKFHQLLASADIYLDASEGRAASALCIAARDIAAAFSGLIAARMSP
ncbi:MAG: CoA transferase, partial [Acetobacteraceae bacterium]